MLAGCTRGTWTSPGNSDNTADYAAVLVEGSVISTPTPSTGATLSSGPSTAPIEENGASEELDGVPPSPTEDTEMWTRGPTCSELSTTSSPSVGLGVIVGSVAGGGAVLVIVAVLVLKAKRRSAHGLDFGTTTYSSAPPRHFPAAAHRVDDSPSPASTVV